MLLSGALTTSLTVQTPFGSHKALPTSSLRMEFLFLFILLNKISLGLSLCASLYVDILKLLSYNTSVIESNRICCSEARKSTHTPSSFKEEQDFLIYNHAPVYTGKEGCVLDLLCITN